MLEVGAQPDTLLFNGQVVDGQFVGTARIFRSACGQLAYRVSGPILDGGRRILLQGEAPHVDQSCHVTGTMTDTLDFRLLDQ
jgi:hypothetical protein